MDLYQKAPSLAYSSPYPYASALAYSSPRLTTAEAQQQQQQQQRVPPLIPMTEPLATADKRLATVQLQPASASASHQRYYAAAAAAEQQATARMPFAAGYGRRLEYPESQQAQYARLLADQVYSQQRAAVVAAQQQQQQHAAKVSTPEMARAAVTRQFKAAYAVAQASRSGSVIGEFVIYHTSLVEGESRAKVFQTSGAC